MHARILTLASLYLLCGLASPAFGQAGGDKQPIAGPQKGPPPINAATEIHGKNFQAWMKLISNPDRSQTEAAIKSILFYPPDVAKQAVPPMIAELEKHFITPIDLSVRVNIPPALAMILSSLKDPDPSQVAQTVTVLKRMLKDQQIVVRFRVAQALAQMGSLAKDAALDLIPLAKDTATWETRHAAVVALGTVAVEKNPSNVNVKVVEVLLFNGMKDLAVKIRLAALQALNDLHVADVPQYKPQLLTALHNMGDKDSDPVCKLRANVFLFPMLTKPAEKKKALESIGKGLDAKDAFVRVEAAQHLGYLGEEAKEQSVRLRSALKDPDMEVMGWVIIALGKIRAQDAVPELTAIKNNNAVPEAFRKTADEALDEIRSKKKSDPKKGGKLP